MMIVNSATSSKIHVFRYPWWLRHLTISIDNRISFAIFSYFSQQQRCLLLVCCPPFVLSKPTNEPCPQLWPTQVMDSKLQGVPWGPRRKEMGGKCFSKVGPKGKLGGFKYVLMITPENWGRCPFRQNIFLNGLKPPPRNPCFCNNDFWIAGPESIFELVAALGPSIQWNLRDLQPRAAARWVVSFPKKSGHGKFAAWGSPKNPYMSRKESKPCSFF